MAWPSDTLLRDRQYLALPSQTTQRKLPDVFPLLCHIVIEQEATENILNPVSQHEICHSVINIQCPETRRAQDAARVTRLSSRILATPSPCFVNTKPGQKDL